MNEIEIKQAVNEFEAVVTDKRKRLGLSNKELAAAIGVSQSELTNAVKNYSFSPRLVKTRAKVRKILGIEV